MTLDDLIAEVAAEELSDEALAVAAIKPYDVERSNETTAKAAKETHGNVLREWFKTHPEDKEIVDKEWNLRAFMQSGGDTRVYSHPNELRRRNISVYERCEELGLFMFNDAAVQEALTKGYITHGDLAGYVHDGERSPSLQVKAIKR